MATKIFYIFLILSVFFLAGIYSCKNVNDKGKVAIAFYNCENLFDTIDNPLKEDDDFTPRGSYHYVTRTYEQKLHNIAIVLQSIPVTQKCPVALCGLCEIENTTVLKDLVNQPELYRQHYQYLMVPGNDLRGINTALLYRSDYFKVIGFDTINIKSKAADTLLKTRNILHVWGVLAGDSVHLFINHWPSRRNNALNRDNYRYTAARTLKLKTDEIRRLNPYIRIIIMGDFNDNPPDSSIALFAAYTNPYITLYKSGAGTEHFGNTWNLFDQILVSPAASASKYRQHYKTAGIYNPAFLKREDGTPRRAFAGTRWQNGFSDHFPVVMFFE